MIEIPRIGIKVQQAFCIVLRFSLLFPFWSLFFDSLSYFHFGVCSSTLSFVSILEFVLHSVSSYFKSYNNCSIIEMIFNKLHIEMF